MLTLDLVIEKLQAGEPFAFSRWGDGEWSAILGRGDRNCDGQEYTPELRTALREVLRSRPGYSLGMQGLARERFGPEIERWLEAEGLADLPWSDAGIFHRASSRGRLGPLFDVLKGRSVILIGPKRLTGLSELFPLVAYAEVPDRDAYGSIATWIVEAFDLAVHAGPKPVVAVSAGMGAKVLIHRLHKALPEHTLIDFGSVWEPYVGHENRTYHRKILERLAA